MASNNHMSWRLIISEPMRGHENMALDEAILESVGKGDAPPTLRLYAWEPPCLSLGYAQSMDDVDPERLRASGWEVVRRPTGGRAILHADEVTYSIALPIDHPHASGSILDSYRHLSKGLVAGLKLLGVDVSVQAPGGATESPNDNPVCFEVPSPYEITAAGKKLLGSAQVRRRTALLQHGTLPLCGDITRITRVLRYADEGERSAAAKQVAHRAITVEDAAGRIVSWDEAVHAIAQGFSDALKVRFHRDDPSPIETECARALAMSHYQSNKWLARK
jgi:lipoate-protein ligase A